MLIPILICCWLLVVLFLLALARAAAIGDRVLEQAPRLRLVRDEEREQRRPTRRSVAL